MRGVYEKIPGSAVWYVRYADATGRIRREKAGVKGAAISLYRKRKTEALQGRKLPEMLRRKTVTFGDLAADALAYSRAHKRTWANDASTMKLLLKWFGHRAADSVAPTEIEQHLARAVEEKGWTPATANRYRALLSLVFRLGIRAKKVDSNPAKEVRTRPEEHPPPRWLRPKEERKLRAAIRRSYREHLPELDLAIHLGLRRSEQYSLTWENVDMDRRVAIIPRSKSGKPRTLPLNAIAFRALQMLQRRCDGMGAVCRNLAGEPLHGPRHWFEPSVEASEIPHLVWHHLRHTFASRLVLAGADIRTVQELMGHASILMTARYAHLSAAHKLAAVNLLVGPTDPRTDTGPRGRAPRRDIKSRKSFVKY